MFIVSKALLISSTTVIVRTGRAIWLNPFATVLFIECRHCRVTCFVHMLRGCVWIVCCYVKKKALLQCDMGLYNVPLSMSSSFFFATLQMCGIMLVLRAAFNMLVRNACPRGPMCFRCLMFSLSRPCELLFLLCFIASWT